MEETLLKELIKEIKELKEKIEISNFENRVAFNARQAANYLSVGYYTILQLARIGDIDFVKNGASYIFRKEHLDGWLDKQEKRTRR